MPVRTDEPNARTKHKVLSVSIEYPNLKGYRFDLPGTHQDSHKICSLLKAPDHFHYSDDDLTILIDDYTRPAELLPTRKNIRTQKREIIMSSTLSFLVMLRFKDRHNCHSSETISRMTRRLEQIIHKLLVEPVQAKGAHFMMIFDCCHSASMAELPYHSFGSLAPDAAQRTSSTTVGKVETKYGLKERSVSKTALSLAQELWAACEDEELALGNRNGGLFMTVITSALDWLCLVQVDDTTLQAFTNVLGRNPYMTHQELLMHVT
ncbi:hypothetical protein IEO21_03984 [Rhodonia placenta]|uniref:Peptidase C14 n=1 Tax=Rhodonia placenta TaxID=104341 RepID=A0A8H7P4L6_9APHY|nr:hypothetical protein IEO21_03984 [Postia placenta]